MRARVLGCTCFTRRRCCVLSVTTRTGGKYGAYKSAAAAADASLTYPSRTRSVIRVNVPSAAPLNLVGGSCLFRLQRLVNSPSDSCHSTLGTITVNGDDPFFLPLGVDLAGVH